jgi:serine/threonine protein kinase
LFGDDGERASERALMPPTTAASKYKKGKQIGRGSFGAVYLGTGALSGEQVVLKEVNLRGLSSKDLKGSMAEVSFLKKLRHPHIIGYRDSYKDPAEGCLTIVMEFAGGGDLGSLISKRAKERSRVGEPEALRMFAQMVDALAYCHGELHLLHRDLKPENVFLTAGGDVKIGDFGISRIVASTNALAHTQCGTPLFMSPELASGKPYSAPSDVWALGCVMYSLLSLKQPWVDRIKSKGALPQPTRCPLTLRKRH